MNQSRIGRIAHSSNRLSLALGSAEDPSIPGVTGVEVLSRRSGSLRRRKVAVRITLLVGAWISLVISIASGRAPWRSSGLGRFHDRCSRAFVARTGAHRVLGKANL